MAYQYPRSERGSVYSENEHQSAHSEYNEEQDHYPSHRGDTSFPGQVRREWDDVVGISREKSKPACPVEPRLFYPRGSFQGLGSSSFAGTSGLHPYHLGTSVNDTHRVRDQQTHPADTSISYPVSPYYGHGLNDTGTVGRQSSSAYGAGTIPGYGAVHQEGYPSGTSTYYANHSRDGRDLIPANDAHVLTPRVSQTGNTNTVLYPGMIPRVTDSPRSGHNDGYPQQPPHDQDFGDRHQHRPSILQPQRSVRHWGSRETADLLRMQKQDMPWHEVSAQIGRSVKDCSNHFSNLERRRKAISAARGQAGGEDGYADPADNGLANVPDVRRIAKNRIDWKHNDLIGWVRIRVREIQDEHSLGFNSACEWVAQEINTKHNLRIGGGTVAENLRKNRSSELELNPIHGQRT